MLIYTNTGYSMYPLIRQSRDIIMIGKPDGKLKKYDIPLYKRDNGQYVLHRIIKVRKDDYVLCGDNCYTKEYGVKDEDIIGVLISLVRDGKEVDFNSFRYKIYVFLWCTLFPVRANILKLKHFVKKYK